MIVSFSSRKFYFSNAGGQTVPLPIMLLYYIKQGIFIFLVKRSPISVPFLQLQLSMQQASMVL